PARACNKPNISALITFCFFCLQQQHWSVTCMVSNCCTARSLPFAPFTKAGVLVVAGVEDRLPIMCYCPLNRSRAHPLSCNGPNKTNQTPSLCSFSFFFFCLCFWSVPLLSFSVVLLWSFCVCIFS